jgi:hypothetical protein
MGVDVNDERARHGQLGNNKIKERIVESRKMK